jgi:hypothetical protein
VRVIATRVIASYRWLAEMWMSSTEIIQNLSLLVPNNTMRIKHYIANTVRFNDTDRELLEMFP